ncbi:MFS transporter [Streptomyces sp. NPDC093544]|uniref:MFS transporter n=1 Tax=Streptomyces sp. NPDC093544 TaxID=3155200 RepID=UPI00343CC14F
MQLRAHQPSEQCTGPFVAALAFAGFVAAITQTVAVPLIPKWPSLLHTSALSASWVVTAALLAGAIVNPIAGRLADMYGKRLVILGSLVLLAIGSLICAVSESVVPAVIGRAVQGASLGIIPVGISLFRDRLPAHKRGVATAVMSSMLGTGAALGQPFSAAVVAHFDWHLLFWFTAVLAVAALLCVVVAVPADSSAARTGSFDGVGALGLTVGLVCLLLPISKGEEWGWTATRTLGLFAASVVVLAAWAVWERRSPAPLIDVRTSIHRTVLIVNGAAVLLGFATYAMTLTITQLLQSPSADDGLGQSALTASLLIAPSGLVMLAMSPVAARVLARRGAKACLAAGSAFMAGGWILGLASMRSLWMLAITGCVIGIGVALAYAAMPMLIATAVPAGQTAAANGLNTLTRSIGTSSCSAVVAAILAGAASSQGIPTLGAFRIAFLCATAAALLALCATTLLPSAQRELGHADGDPAGRRVPEIRPPGRNHYKKSKR